MAASGAKRMFAHSSYGEPNPEACSISDEIDERGKFSTSDWRASPTMEELDDEFVRCSKKTVK